MAGLIEDQDGGASTPQIAFDGTGSAIAVWSQSDGFAYRIWSNRYTFGSGWGGAEIIGSEDTGYASVPQIAVEGSGNAMTVWYQYDGTNYTIWSNRYTPGSGWGSAELIKTDNVGSALDPQIALDGFGNAIAVWQRSNDAVFNVHAAHYR